MVKQKHQTVPASHRCVDDCKNGQHIINKYTMRCPDAPHHHIGNSGPICEGDMEQEQHPEWCIAQHWVNDTLVLG